MVKAQHIADKAEFLDRRIAGSFHVSAPDSDGELSFYYCCPCGCERIAPLNAGNNFKPADGPSWNWNGSLSQATLHPSVHHVGHWHGWLTDGEWKVC